MEHVTFEKITVAGLKIRTTNAAETNPETAAIGKLWQSVTRSGPPMETAMAAWQEVWDYFRQPEVPKRAYLYNVEVYSGTDTLDLYIGIKGED